MGIGTDIVFMFKVNKYLFCCRPHVDYYICIGLDSPFGSPHHYSEIIVRINKIVYINLLEL